MTAIVTFCVMLQARSFTTLSMTVSVATAIVVCVTLAYISTMTYLASCWVFPIPFTFAVGLASYFVFVVIFSMCIVGLKVFKDTPGLAKNFVRFVLFISTLDMLSIFYPGYNAAFNVVPDSVQPLLVLVLPVMKPILKNVMAAHIGAMRTSCPSQPRSPSSSSTRSTW